MRLSDVPSVLDIANTRATAGTLIDAVERGLDLELSVSGLDGVALTFTGKELPQLETWLRLILSEAGDELAAYGVEGDTPISVLPPVEATPASDEAA